MKIFRILRCCILGVRISVIRGEISDERVRISNRSDKYHGGRLDVDSLMHDYIIERRVRIMGIKRDIVKIRKNGR